MSLSTAATFYRTAVLLGLVRPNAVIQWADRVIAEEDTPPSAFFDLATTPAELTAVRAALEPLAEDPVPWPVLRSVLALAARDLAAGRRSADDSVHVLRQVRQLTILPPSAEAEVDTLQDDYMLAMAGIRHDPDAVRERIREWFAQFAVEAPPSAVLFEGATE